MTCLMPKAIGTSAANPAAPDRFAEARAKLFPLLRNRSLAEAADALSQDRTELAEPILKRHLDKRPNDTDALNLMADIARRGGRYDEAERLLSRAVSLAPDHPGYRFNLAVILRRQDKFDEALAQLDAVSEAHPRNPLAREQKAAIMPLLGRHDDALDLRRGLVEEYPDWPEAWLQYGQALRRMGFVDQAIAAWRKALTLQPKAVTAYANLADLKTYRFEESEIAGMQALLADADVPAADRARLHFALGKAHGEEMRYARSFEHFSKANALLRAGASFDPERFTAFRQICERQFTPEFFRAREKWGCESRAPIFIVGMPRSGSTLVEQILSSHSAIEGLGELAELDTLTGQAMSSRTGRPAHEFWIGGWFEFRGGLIEEFPRVLERLADNDFRRLGADYVAAAVRRKSTSRPHFTDKGLRNFAAD
jgi:tetratricopeptide (TPR) repeat protein